MSKGCGISKDIWLSSILGKNTYVLDLEFLKRNAVISVPAERSLLVVKAPTLDVEAAMKAQENNFYLVDTNIQFEKNVKQENVANSKINIRFSEAADEDAVIEIARSSFVFDRFHSDPNIAKEIAEKIKIEWVKNFFKGVRGKWMIVAEIDKQIAGFLQALELDNYGVIIDLIAVEANARKMGVAANLINFAECNCIKKFGYIRVGTQISNIPSISLYVSAGFKFLSSQYIFHRHIEV